MATRTKAHLEGRVKRLEAALARANAKSAALGKSLHETLERQKATADILQLIARSTTDVQPVFCGIADAAFRLLGDVGAVVTRLSGDMLHLAAFTSTDKAGDEALRGLFPCRVADLPTHGRAIRTRAPYCVSDTEKAAARIRRVARARGYRSAVFVPLLHDNVPVGTVAVSRRSPGSFSEQEILLLKTFADQAVIAIANARVFNDAKESLEQQTAISEVLRVMSTSPTNVRPVLDTVAERAARICEANDVRIFLVDNDVLRYSAGIGALGALELGEMRRIDRGFITGRAVLDRVPLQVDDLTSSEARAQFPLGVELQERFGHRTTFAMPLVRENRALGVILLRRLEVRPFSDKQIALLKTFADQAAIAIENVRLFKELEARNAELTQSLEQQTATSEVLKIISRSTFDLEPVLQALVDNAARLCRANRGVLFRQDGEMYALAASYNATSELQHIFQSNPIAADRGTVSGRAMLERQAVHVADVLADPEYQWSEAARVGNYRTVLGVPLLREGIPIGVMGMTRDKVEPFTGQEIALVTTFADQAVIAIENVRLFTELQARNAELIESLEQQTATSEILRVISSSLTDTQPVFDAIVRSGALLFEGANVSLRLVSADQVEHVASSHDRDRTVFSLDDDRQPSTRAIRRKEVIVVNDMLTEDWITNEARDRARRRGFRGLIAAPLMRGGEVIGTLAMNRPAPGPFTRRQIDLLKTFADQAVIAIENVRLFKELEARNAQLRESLEHQTATAEVLGIISRSPTEVQPVLDAIVESAARTCRIDDVVLRLREEGVMSPRAHVGEMPIYRRDIGVDEPQYAWMLEHGALHIPDVRQPSEFPLVGLGQPYRTHLSAPLRQRGQLIGVLNARRMDVRPFTPAQIKLLETFADQAVIAIENVRLFKELQAQTEALSRSVNQLTALGEVGQAISSTLDLETVLNTIVSRALQLTGLDAGSIYEYDPQAQVFRLQASENVPEEITAAVRQAPIRLGDGVVGRIGVNHEVAQVPDILDPGYRSGRRDLLVREGYRAVLAVPLLREDQLLGVLLVHRKSPGAFATEIVGLLKTFATQSAMAIQNARLFREIAEKSRQLEDASRHKSQFLASMSHELRTPLNAMLGFNEMILGEIYGPVPADLKDPLSDIQSSGKHLLRLINNVLDLAKIEAGRMELSLADYSVHDTVESVRSTLHPLAAEKGLEFTVSVPESIPFAHGDFGRITQCLMNLAGNSLKFTKEGSVRIAVDLNGEFLVFRVTDTGIGIPGDKIETLFTEFRQSDATIASEFGGTGLGLSITRKFVEMHGGRIWVESELGKGSQFIFEIPLRAREGESA